MNTPRLVEVREKVLKQNDILARALRQNFKLAGVFVASFVSSPGSGKTKLLEKTLSVLNKKYSMAVLVGDLATDNDAVRLAATNVPVKQIITGTICHLDATMIDNSLQEWDLNKLDALFIENVGNLVCPSSYDLGEELRLVLMSVTEGEDKPLKYATIFNTADIAIITKLDLAEAVEFDFSLAHKNIQAVRPGIKVFELSAKTGQGMDKWLEFIQENLKKG